MHQSERQICEFGVESSRERKRDRDRENENKFAVFNFLQSTKW